MTNQALREKIRDIEKEVLEELGFPGRPIKAEGIVLEAIWILLIRARRNEAKLLEEVRNAIITDQATGAGDYSEAEEYADKIKRLEAQNGPISKLPKSTQ